MPLSQPTSARPIGSTAAFIAALSLACSSALADVKIADRTVFDTHRVPQATLEVEDASNDGSSILKVKRNVSGTETTIVDVTNQGLVTINSASTDDSGLRLNELTSTSAPTLASEPLAVDATGKVVLGSSVTMTPVYQYYRSSVVSNIPANSTITLSAAFEDINDGSFTLASNQLTAQTAGTYWIKMIIPWSGLEAKLVDSALNLLVNNVVRRNIFGRTNYFGSGIQGSGSTFVLSDVVELDVNDVIHFTVTNSIADDTYHLQRNLLILRL
ncbi:hypothetical protein OAS86_06850 [Gammaproteobacteria bacterium]|nr:hypothetical protein [Gammaproteobacteria bacterium]